MEYRKITTEQIAAYEHYLQTEERAPATAEKYMRHIQRFTLWLGERSVVREAVTGCPEWVFPFSGLGGLPGQVSENPAPDVPGAVQRTDPRGL